jgi:hypothetical protein
VREYAERYPKLIKAYCQKQNTYSMKDKTKKGALRATFRNWRIGKYEALCEGDDYWTDPLKLQKQVDIFIKHPDTIICGGRANTWNQTTKEFTHIKPSLDKMATCLSSHEFFYWGDWLPTCTRMVPAKHMKSIPHNFASDFRHVHYLLASNPTMNVRFLPSVVAVYRVHPGGVYSSETPCEKLTNYFHSTSIIATLYGEQRKAIMQKKAVDTARKLLKSHNLCFAQRLRYFSYIASREIQALNFSNLGFFLSKWKILWLDIRRLFTGPSSKPTAPEN